MSSSVKVFLGVPWCCCCCVRRAVRCRCRCRYRCRCWCLSHPWMRSTGSMIWTPQTLFTKNKWCGVIWLVGFSSSYLQLLQSNDNWLLQTHHPPDQENPSPQNHERPELEHARVRDTPSRNPEAYHPAQTDCMRNLFINFEKHIS